MLKNSKKLLYYVGASISQGQTLSGVDLGPQAIRNANLFTSLEHKGYQVKDQGDICPKIITPDVAEKMNKLYKGSQINNIQQLDPMLEALQKKVFEVASKKDGFVLTVGGDHSIATGSISGLKKVHENLKVIWVDAHSDIGLPHMSDSATYHGKPVSHLMGMIRQKDIPGFKWLEDACLKPEDIVYIGIRDLDTDEIKTLKDYNIKCFTLDHIIRHGGIGPVMEKAIDYLDPKKEGLPLHCSFDIDGIDPIYAPGTGTRARGGLDYRESTYLLRRLNEENFISMDMVEINPSLDPQEKTEKLFGDDPHIQGTQTVQLGCDLILSALGRNNLFKLGD